MKSERYPAGFDGLTNLTTLNVVSFVLDVVVSSFILFYVVLPYF